MSKIKDSIIKRLKALIVKFHNTTSVDDRLEIATTYIKLQLINIQLFEDDITKGVPNHEVWRNIVGYEGIYQISNWGGLHAMEGFFIKKRSRNAKFMAVYKPKTLRIRGHHCFGYLRIALWKDEIAEHQSIHRLVATYFIPNPNNYPKVLHIDNNPANPHFKNLMWGTQKMNIQHAVESGRWHIGAKNNKTKLHSSDIPKIRKLLKQGISTSKIAPLFGVGESAIGSIRNNKTWKHIK